jgi:hypothetical protein
VTVALPLLGNAGLKRLSIVDVKMELPSMSPARVTAAVGVGSLESNTQGKSNTGRGILEAVSVAKKLRRCGGFQAVSPLTHMNRHNNKHAGKTKTKP